MVRRSLGLLLGGLLTFVLAAPAFAGPAVTVRIEGASDTLVAQTAVTTQAGDLVKDGDPAHTCSTLSAAGGLEQTTAGAWSGPWYDGLGYSVATIKEETHLFGSGSYWGYFLNGYLAPTGICDAVQQGDDIVFAPISEAGTTGLLELGALPATVAPGASLGVNVKRLSTVFETTPPYGSVNAAEPAPGVTVSGGGQSATTDAGGQAKLTFTARGAVTLRALNAADVRSATATTCVTDGADGFCGTKTPAGETLQPAPAPSPASAVLAAATDRIASIGSLAAIGEQQRFTRAKAPRELRGSVDDEASGIKEIRLRLTRRSGKRCERYDGARERWVAAARCGAVNGTFFSIGDRTPWSYLLPQALTKGRYVLDTQVVDRAGNATRGSTRGRPGTARNQVVFFVD